MSPEIEVAPSHDAQEYDKFALAYDHWIAGDFCSRALPIITDLLLRRIPARSRILDLCCGTGQMAAALTNRGYQVTGIDISRNMVHHARKNAPLASFFVSDVRHLRLMSPHDAALSTFNSLAHFSTAQDLLEVFRSVRAALQTGSPFLFDLSMEEAYASKWCGSFSLIADDQVCIVRPSYDASLRLATNHITLFSSASPNSGDLDRRSCNALSNLYSRTEFSIHQTCHLETDVRESLLLAGFNRVDSYDAERDLGMVGEAGRRFFLCR